MAEASLKISRRSVLYRRVDSVEQALEQLYRSRYGRFEAVLRAVTRDPEAARDAVQEAFSLALAKRRQFRGDGSLEAWVWAIALRVAAAGRSTSSTPTTEAFDPALPRRESDPALADAIRALAPRRRLFIFLRYFADLSYDEIAEACGVSPGTVAAALSQAREQLGDALDPKRSAEGAVR